MTARRPILAPAALALVLAACGGSSSDATSKAGTELFADATGAGKAATAVSFRLQANGGGTADESFVRRGADSVVVGSYDAGGTNEVRRVGGVYYARADLELPGGQVAPWIRIDDDPAQDLWLGLLGDRIVAPTPKETTGLLTGNVARVTALEAGDPRVLAVDAKRVAQGERPDTVSVAAKAARFVGRSAVLFVGGNQIAQRTYSKVLWNDAVAPITVPEGAVSVDGIRDPQAAALPAALLRAPAALPEGWTLRGVVGITGSQSDGTCQQVLTLYAPTTRSPLSAGYLAVYQIGRAHV